MIYLYNYIFLFALGGVGDFKYKKFFLVCFLFYLFFIVGFRGEIDPDFLNYKKIFDLAPSLYFGISDVIDFSKSMGFELIYIFLVSVIKYLNLEFYWVNVVFSFFSTLFIYKISILLNKKINLNLFYCSMVIYANSLIGIFVQIRFGLAALIVFYALILAFNKSYLTSVVWALISCFIHSISFFYFPVVFLYFVFSRVNFNKKIIFCGLVFLFCLIPLLNISENLSILFYMINERYSDYDAFGTGNYYGVMLRVAIIIFFIFLLDFSRLSDLEIGLLFLTVLSVLFWVLSLEMAILYRLGVLAEFGYVVFLSKGRYKSKYYYYLCFVVLTGLLLSRVIAASSDLNFYETIFRRYW